MNATYPLQSDFAVERIERELVHRILRETYRADEYLPSLDRLCDEFRVSYHTLRAAMARLEARGLILKVNGVGHRVVPLDASIDVGLMSAVIEEARHEPARRWSLLAQVSGFLRFLHKEMADRAAVHRSSSQLEWLRHVIRMTQDRLDLNVPRAGIGECEHQFARILSSASGCIAHTAVVNSVRGLFVSDAFTCGAKSILTVKDYWALTDAMSQRDAARAREIVDVAWWVVEEHAIAELKKLGWTETSGGGSPTPE